MFILAAFLGLEVIKRVSPLLHTPLMSLTNAISAISVIAAIELAGRQQTVLVDGAGDARGGRGIHQHRRRVHDHRPHAQDVQEARGEAMNSLSLRSITVPTQARHHRRRRHDLLRCRGGAVRAGAQVAQRPDDRPPGKHRRADRHGAAIVGALLQHEIIGYQWIIVGVRRRRR